MRRESGNGPPLFLFHSLLSDRASFDAIAPDLSRSFRVIVPELPGFGGSPAVRGGLAGGRRPHGGGGDRMAPAADAIVLGNGYGGFVALQMAIRHPGIASQLILADCGAAFSQAGREAFRNMAAASKAKGLAAITDVAMRRLFAPEFQAAASGSDARPPRGVSANRPRRVSRRLQRAGRTRSPARPRNRSRCPSLVLVGEHDEATPPPMSHELAAGLPNAQ